MARDHLKINGQCVKLFQPPAFEPKKLCIEKLDEQFGKKMIYASKGRFAIGHICRSLNLSNPTVLISPYMCPTVQKELIKMGCTVQYYDIDPDDMNPDVNSVKKRIEETKATVVVAPSLGGFPADLSSLERICKDANVYLIDDAAQSYGAALDGRYVGTFGDGGVISFSPGKATAGHMGAFFWTKNDAYTIKRKHHYIVHKLCWLDFRNNRQKIYDNRFIKLTSIFKYANIALQKYVDIRNDDVEKFEQTILGGVLDSAVGSWKKFRQMYYQKFINIYGDCGVFSVIKAKRGEGNPHKIQLRFSSPEANEKFLRFMRECNIFAYPGYKVLVDHLELFPGCKKINGCIAELPIEDNDDRMRYLFECVEKYVEKSRYEK